MAAEVNDVWDFWSSIENQQRLIGIARATAGEQSGWHQRQIDIATRARSIIGECIGETLSELAVSPEGFDFSIDIDRVEFLSALQAGAVLAAIDLGNAETNTEFFTALAGE